MSISRRTNLLIKKCLKQITSLCFSHTLCLSVVSFGFRCDSTRLQFFWHPLWSHRTIMSLKNWVAFLFWNLKISTEKMFNFIRNKHNSLYIPQFFGSQFEPLFICRFLLTSSHFDSFAASTLRFLNETQKSKWRRKKGEKENYSWIKCLTSISSNEFLIIFWSYEWEYRASV